MRNLKPSYYSLFALILLCSLIVFERTVFSLFERWNFNSTVEHTINRSVMKSWNPSKENFSQHTNISCGSVNIDNDENFDSLLLTYGSCRMVIGTISYYNPCGWLFEGIYCAGIVVRNEHFSNTSFNVALANALRDPCAIFEKFGNQDDKGFVLSRSVMKCSIPILHWTFYVGVVHDENVILYKYIRKTGSFLKI